MTPTLPSLFTRSVEPPTPALWPTMLRAAGWGLRPERVLVALVAVVLVSLIARIPLPWEDSQSLLSLWRTGPELREPWSWHAPWSLVARLGRILTGHPWAAAAVGFPVVFVTLCAMATIARMTAVELANGELVSARRAFGLVRARAGSLLAVVLIPTGLVLLVLLAFAAFGAVLLSFGGVNVVGAVLYGIAVLGSIALVVFAAAYVVAAPMLAPAVVCEGGGSGEHGRGDAIDALQRVLAYVLAAPLRLAVYGGIGLIQVLAVMWLGSLLADGAASVARSACTHWLSVDAMRTLEASNEAERTLAASIMAFWEWVPGLLVSACALSVASSAAAVLYLLIRRVCDGQHEREIWMPTPTAEQLRATEVPQSAEQGSESQDDD